MPARIAFIGFGEAARAFRASLAGHRPALAFSAYDILLDAEGLSGACADAMRAAGVDVAPTPRDAVAGADWVFSAVTADRSLAAAASVAGLLAPGQVFLDINSVSPGRKRRSAALLAGGGGRYVDMAVMAPVHPKGHRTPVLIAGAADRDLLAGLAGLDFDFTVAGAAPGDATAIKMVRSLFVKGLEAITVETLLAAEASGCLDYVFRSLARSYPGLDLPTLAPYQIERTLRHGTRRSAEMRECAVTLDELALGGELARAIAIVQGAMGALGDTAAGDEPLADRLAALLAARRSSADNTK